MWKGVIHKKKEGEIMLEVCVISTVLLTITLMFLVLIRLSMKGKNTTVTDIIAIIMIVSQMFAIVTIWTLYQYVG